MIIYSGSSIISLRLAPNDGAPGIVVGIGRKGEAPDGEVRLRLSAVKTLIAALQRDVATLEGPTTKPANTRPRDLEPVHRPGVPHGRKRVSP